MWATQGKPVVHHQHMLDIHKTGVPHGSFYKNVPKLCQLLSTYIMTSVLWE